MPRFLSVCLNPTFQRTISISHLHRGEVSRARSAQLDIAGKGVNTTRVLSQLGAPVRHLTHLGQGKELLLDLCGREGLEIVWAPSNSPIRTCITLLDDETRSTTEIVEPTEPVDEGTVKTIRDLYSKELESADWVILSGTKAPGYPADLFAEFSGMAVRRGRTVAVDYRGPELLASLDAGISVVKINLVEFVTTFLPGMKVSEGDDSGRSAAGHGKNEGTVNEGLRLCDYPGRPGGSVLPERFNRYSESAEDSAGEFDRFRRCVLRRTVLQAFRRIVPGRCRGGRGPLRRGQCGTVETGDLEMRHFEEYQSCPF